MNYWEYYDWLINPYLFYEFIFVNEKYRFISEVISSNSSKFKDLLNIQNV